MDNFILFKKAYELVVWLYPLVMKFPKHQRFALSQQILNTEIYFLKILIEANSSSRKLYILRRASVELEKIRFLLRLSKDLRFLSIRKYELFCEKNNEVGRILGGLIRKLSVKKPS